MGVFIFNKKKFYEFKFAWEGNLCKITRSREAKFSSILYYRMHKMSTWSSAVRKSSPRRSWFCRRRSEPGTADVASWRWRTAVSPCRQHGGPTLPEKDS